MKNTIILIILFYSLQSFSQDFQKVEIIQTVPDKIKNLINNEPIFEIESVDFNGDNDSDFIISTKLEEQNYEIYEYWITSEYNIVLIRKTYNFGIKVRRFINLDKDPEMEIINASGYEDGIDYTIQDLDLKLGNLKNVLYFNPVIINDSKLYWGYPWDWTEIKLKSNNLIYASINHRIERDGEITVPKDQKIMPIIYFNGKPTQESSVKDYKHNEWLSLDELINNCR